MGYPVPAARQPSNGRFFRSRVAIVGTSGRFSPVSGRREDGASEADGGYGHEFVDKVPEKYICSICTKVLRDACLAGCCGQHFCNFCLTKWLNQGPLHTCPHCRAVGFQRVLNKEKIREIKEFKIYCIHRGIGCEWVGELQALEDHLKSDRGCGCVTVTCSLSAYTGRNLFEWRRVVCGEKVERRHLAAHKDVCRCREYRCEYCGHVDTYDAIAGTGQFSRFRSTDENHYQKCDNFPLECVNKCGEVDIKRMDMPAHRNVCLLEQLKCPFDSLCAATILRRDMESHKKECDFRPYTCQYCGSIGTFISVNGRGKFWMWNKPSHYEQCGDFPLECVNKCGEKDIKRKEMNAHRAKCPLESLDCQLGQHPSAPKILRKDMDKHKNEECEFRPFTCQYCNHVGTYKSITGKGESVLKDKRHYDVCQHYPLKCPNQCGAENIKRRNMALHPNKCPLEPLDCPFKYAGCADPILRKDMDRHCQESMQNHLLLMAKSQQELVRKNEELARKNDDLTRKHTDLTRKYQEVSRKNDELTGEVKELAKKLDTKNPKQTSYQSPQY